MVSFPLSVVDNFFDNPDDIRDYALSLKYHSDEKGSYPSLRTDKIHKFNEPLFDMVCRKILSVYYEFHELTHISWNTNMSFQKVDQSFRSGWIHKDTPAILSCIIYLNPKPSKNSGTSIYKLKNGVLVQDESLDKIKKDAYLGKIKIKEAEGARVKNNSQYDEVIKVSNSYNRLVMFDSSEHHGALDFFGNTEEDSRLTLTVFFYEINVCNTPISRLKRVS